jgi:hypothetical protein
MVKYLSKNLNELRESDEVIECLEIIENLNNGAWLKVLKAAVDIFNGKMVGLAGLPD